MNHLLKGELPNQFSVEDLKILLNLSEKKSHEWFIISNKMTNDHYLQLDKFKREIDSEKYKEFVDASPENEKKMKLYYLNWAATRWNDNNYNLDWESKESDKYRKNKLGRISKTRRERIDSQQKTENFTFFSSKSSPFSTFHDSLFIIQDIRYHSVVQYIMKQKASLFLDEESEIQILESKDSGQAYELGKKVTNFNKGTWRNMYFGNHLKFAFQQKFDQNNDSRNHLFSTVGTTIVLSCQSDNYFGIGLSRNEKEVTNRNKWNGKNILGELLTDVRFELMGKY
jgi:ribA/ribD-fused uncharacterized protein